MEGKDILIIVLFAAGAAVVATVAMKILGIEDTVMYAGAVAGGVAGAIAGLLVAKKRQAESKG